MHQFENPLPYLPRGIQKKEDAFKIAQWMIRQHAKTGHWENLMSPNIAHELKITTDL